MKYDSIMSVMNKQRNVNCNQIDLYISHYA